MYNESCCAWLSDQNKNMFYRFWGGRIKIVPLPSVKSLLIHSATVERTQQSSLRGWWSIMETVTVAQIVVGVTADWSMTADGQQEEDELRPRIWSSGAPMFLLHAPGNKGHMTSSMSADRCLFVDCTESKSIAWSIFPGNKNQYIYKSQMMSRDKPMRVERAIVMGESAGTKVCLPGLREEETNRRQRDETQDSWPDTHWEINTTSPFSPGSPLSSVSLSLYSPLSHFLLLSGIHP